jgi:hypothetical protein
MTKEVLEAWGGSGWRLGEALGRGTFARVYSAKNTITGKQGAVKVINAALACLPKPRRTRRKAA